MRPSMNMLLASSSAVGIVSNRLRACGMASAGSSRWRFRELPEDDPPPTGVVLRSMLMAAGVAGATTLTSGESDELDKREACGWPR
jgi:hypothetical protein